MLRFYGMHYSNNTFYASNGHQVTFGSRHSHFINSTICACVLISFMKCYNSPKGHAASIVHLYRTSSALIGGSLLTIFCALAVPRGIPNHVGACSLQERLCQTGKINSRSTSAQSCGYFVHCAMHLFGSYILNS